MSNTFSLFYNLFKGINKRLKTHWVWFIILLVILLNFGFGLTRLPYYAGVDEPFWLYDRVPNFWTAVKNQTWELTQINDKPGITVALISGMGLPWADPIKFKNSRDFGLKPDVVEGMLHNNFALRLPVLLFNLAMLPIFYFFLRKLLDEKKAVLSLILIGLSPILLGITLIINPDALFWIFLPLSILSFLTYQKENKEKYLYLSGLFLGFSLLTKYVSNILFPYFLALLILDYFFFSQEPKKFWVFLKQIFFQMTKLGLTAIATFALFFPAAWVHPKRIILGSTINSRPFREVGKIITSLLPEPLTSLGQDISLAIIGVLGVLTFSLVIYLSLKLAKNLLIYRKLILKILLGLFLFLIVVVLVNTYLGMKWYDFESILASPKSSFKFNGFIGLILSDVWGLIFAISPIALFGVIISIIVKLFKKEIDRESYLIFSFIFLILLYYFASTLNEISASVRYQIALFPLILIIAGIGLGKTIDFIQNENIKQYLTPLNSYLGLIVLMTISLFFIKPFYFAYSSFLLPQKYIVNMKDMGDGSYEAAMYLNKLPDAESTTIWSDKGGVCEFFVGKCELGLDRKKFKKELDYYVISAGREVRSVNAGTIELRPVINIKNLYQFEKTAHKIIIGGRERNWVKVISVEDFPTNKTSND